MLRQGKLQTPELAKQAQNRVAELKMRAERLGGELLKAIPKAIPIQGNTLTSTGGRKASLPEGITPKQSHYFHDYSIAEYPAPISR